jgi:hypothetical protein
MDNLVLLYLCIILCNCRNTEQGRAMKWHLASPTACSHSWWPCPESSWTDRLFLKTSPELMLITSGTKSFCYLRLLCNLIPFSFVLFLLVLISPEIENSWLCSLNNPPSVPRQFHNPLPAFSSGSIYDSIPSICALKGIFQLHDCWLRVLQPSQTSLAQETWNIKGLYR